MVNDLLRRMLFLPPQASSVAAEIDHLHYFIIFVTMAGAAAVTALAVVFTIKYRSPAGAPIERERPAPRASLKVELGLVVGLLGLFCLWWLIGFAQYVRIETPPADTLDIYVTAKQWMWKFSYPDGQSSIGVVTVPAGRPVKLLLGSRDVIHSFYVPDFRVKQDAVPGRTTALWFDVKQPGTHQILCAEYCGTGHSVMRGQVVALAADDYRRWLERGQLPPSLSAGEQAEEPRMGRAEMQSVGARGETPRDLAGLGEQVAARQGCLRCHTLDGSPHIGPSFAGLYRARVPLVTGGDIVADEAFLTESMMDPLARLHRGYAPVMPSYHGLLEPAEVGGLIALMKSLAPPASGANATAAPAGSIGRAAPIGAPASVGENRADTSQAGVPPAGTVPNPPATGPISLPAPAPLFPLEPVR
jgi:cytochrome c oxidase subunit 2